MIYLNNSASGFPKFPNVTETVKRALDDGLIFCNRDSVESKDVAQKIFSLRRLLGTIIGAKENHSICLTSNATIALNYIIQGITWKKDDCILVGEMEHNSLLRPLLKICDEKGCSLVFIKPNKDTVSEAIRKNPKITYCFLSHVNNVTGEKIPANKIGAVLKEYNIPFILDASQSIGCVPIDVEKMYATAVVFAGHKFLNAPQGTGGFYIRSGDFSKKLSPFIYGGTGNNSGELRPETIYPDSFEIGTPAVHDLLGFYQTLVELEKIGFMEYYIKLAQTAKYMSDALKKIDNIILYGNSMSPIVSFNIKGHVCGEIGQILAKHDIICRTGLHCNAMSTKILHTEKYGGTVRLSCGYYTTKEEIDTVINILKGVDTA